jgi:hypothetical protein
MTADDLVNVHRNLFEYLPDIADVVIARAKKNPSVMEAIWDFEKACTFAEDKKTSPEDREIWAEIRSELADELRYCAARAEQP